MCPFSYLNDRTELVSPSDRKVSEAVEPHFVLLVVTDLTAMHRPVGGRHVEADDDDDDDNDSRSSWTESHGKHLWVTKWGR